MLNKNEQAVYNALTLYADDEGEIDQNISYESIAEVAGVGKTNRTECVRRLVHCLHEKGYINMVNHQGVHLKEISILK